MAKPMFKVGLTGSIDLDSDLFLTEILHTADFRKLEEELMKKSIKWSGDMSFQGEDWLAQAEGNIPYIYSTKDISHSRWTGGFDASADLTFGIGHSIKSADEFDIIKKFVATHNDSEIAMEVGRYLRDDLTDAVKRVNDFARRNNVFLEQHEFDAVVSLVFNYPAALTDSSTLGKLLTADTFTEVEIKEGFRYTMSGGVRIDGLVTRRNNELNLFFTGDYNDYYDTKQKIKDAGLERIDYP